MTALKTEPTVSEKNLGESLWKPKSSIVAVSSESDFPITLEKLEERRASQGGETKGTEANIDVAWTLVQSEGVFRDNIRHAYEDLVLYAFIYLDQELFGKGYRYSLKFQTIRLSDNKIQNNDLEGYYGGTGRIDDDIGTMGRWYVFKMEWSRAHNAVCGDSGMFSFRPYFIADKNDYFDGMIHFTARSEFDVGEDHYFLIEEPTYDIKHNP